MSTTMDDPTMHEHARDMVGRVWNVMNGRGWSDADRVVIAAFTLARLIADNVGIDDTPMVFHTWAGEIERGNWGKFSNKP